MPAILVSVPIVALLLLTPWDGRSTSFGNRVWGRGTDHPDHATAGFWQEFNWLVLRNPVNNLHAETLSVPMRGYSTEGDPGIGDKLHGGEYRVAMGPLWEFYSVTTYTLFGRRCVRVRAGWKIQGNATGRAAFVFMANPLKPYRGT